MIPPYASHAPSALDTIIRALEAEDVPAVRQIATYVTRVGIRLPGELAQAINDFLAAHEDPVMPS